MFCGEGAFAPSPHLFAVVVVFLAEYAGNPALSEPRLLSGCFYARKDRGARGLFFFRGAD